MKKLWIVLLFAAGCAHPPPNISPAAQQAWNKTRVIKALDLFRDAAIDAEANKALSTNTTRKIVQYHQASLKVMQATDVGWKQAVLTSLDALVENLAPGEMGTLRPYLDLVRVLLNEVKVAENCKPWPYPAGIKGVIVCDAGVAITATISGWTIGKDYIR